MDKAPMSKIEQDLIIEQLEVCKTYEAQYLSSPFDKIIGIALESFDSQQLPINGLRHPIQSEHSSNWFIWAGEYSEAGDFFKPVHIHHLLEICPKALKFLGLGPGWRFLFAPNYEDVWYDANLLKI